MAAAMPLSLKQTHAKDPVIGAKKAPEMRTLSDRMDRPTGATLYTEGMMWGEVVKLLSALDVMSQLPKRDVSIREFSLKNRGHS